ncbi:hypothetical protein CERSUDRAFT_113441 [Gelatoporia subvermispora B]|uniref:Uncharacterized protein n=1 Tax=Ceriporiopsis subvermispora (strain B) TaxID=914234 RepID=M2RIG8_CERS8|nr:hypothetical protein CERSUDRAFT_113441 [Gelatoporia subvermispora B]
MTEVEMDDLSKKRQAVDADDAAEHPTSGPNITSDADDQVVAYWAWATAALLSTLSLLLILFPRFVLFLSETGEVDRRPNMTSLEAFLLLHTGILLGAIAIAVIFNIPQPSVALSEARPQGPQGHPLLGPLSGACTLIAFLSYNMRSVGSLAFMVCIGAAIIGVWGLWAVMFAGSSYISRKTGADKRTSRFLFGNKAAASVQKKQWKEQLRSKFA